MLRVDVTIRAARCSRPRLRPAPCWLLAREAAPRPDEQKPLPVELRHQRVSDRRPCGCFSGCLPASPARPASAAVPLWLRQARPGCPPGPVLEQATASGAAETRPTWTGAHVRKRKAYLDLALKTGCLPSAVRHQRPTEKKNVKSEAVVALAFNSSRWEAEASQGSIVRLCLKKQN